MPSVPVQPDATAPGFFIFCKRSPVPPSLDMMETLIHADVFFFVTTVAVVIVGALMVIALIYVITILARFKEMLARARAAGERIYSIYYFIRNIFKPLT